MTTGGPSQWIRPPDGSNCSATCNEVDKKYDEGDDQQRVDDVPAYMHREAQDPEQQQYADDCVQHESISFLILMDRGEQTEIHRGLLALLPIEPALTGLRSSSIPEGWVSHSESVSVLFRCAAVPNCTHSVLYQGLQIWWRFSVIERFPRQRGISEQLRGTPAKRLPLAPL